MERKPGTWQELHNRMTRRGIPAHLVSAAVDAFRQEVSDAKRAKLFARHHRRLWSLLLRPLTYELDSARTGLRYARQSPTPNPAKVEALQSYVVLLEELAMRLVEHRDDRAHTPSQLAKLYNNEFRERAKGQLVPNSGEHWTDWVPLNERMEVSRLFALAPREKHARLRVPFQRTMPRSLSGQAAAALRRRTLKELEPLDAILAAYPDHPEREKLQAKAGRMRAALAKLDEAKPNDFIPTTWQALLNQDVSES